MSLSVDGNSQYTIKDYRFSLKRMVSRLEDLEGAKITTEKIIAYIAFMWNEYRYERNGVERPLSPLSFRNIWCALRSFYNWAESELGIARADNGSSRKPSAITPFNSEEVKALLLEPGLYRLQVEI